MALYINGNKTGGGGGNTDIVYLTQAEYDALPDSKLSDDKVYMITDANGDGSQFQPVIYSEDEREIGVWTDGKPLYQKTYINVSLQNNSDTTLETNVSEFEIKDFETDFIGVPANVVKLRNCDDSLYVNNNGSLIYWIYASSWYVGLSVANITVRYTKTTDAAGSGTWTPQGIPAVHYNTDEQVVGTWIDGSTVYQKTYVAITDTQYGSENAYLIGTIPNGLDNVIDFEGSLKTSDGYGYSSLNGIGTITNWNFGIHISNTNLLLYSGSSFYSLPQNATCIVTIKYTKTSQGGN